MLESFLNAPSASLTKKRFSILCIFVSYCEALWSGKSTRLVAESIVLGRGEHNRLILRHKKLTEKDEIWQVLTGTGTESEELASSG
jgi:hypothetical protein